MNKGQLTENAQRLLAYAIVSARETDRENRKLTCMLSFEYHDAIERMAILQGTTKTAVIRQAIDELVKQFGEDTLYPSVELRVIGAEE
jgi:hypothetical protein